MNTLQTILLVVQVFIALGLIAIILVQHGKGADAGAAFGSGASSTVFGSQGSGNFLTKTTAVLTVVFLANSLTLGYLAANTSEALSLMEQHAAEQSQSTPTGESVESPQLPDSETAAGDEAGAGTGDMPAIPQ